MSLSLVSIVQAISNVFHAVVNDNTTVPLTVVAAYATGSVLLYFLTRGKEFLIAGYSAALFLVPFIHLS